MKLPKIPISGQAVSPDWGREVVDCLRSLRPSSGPGMRITHTPEGTSYSSFKTAATTSNITREPFELQLRTIGEGLYLYMYVGDNPGSLVRRNGYLAAMGSTIVVGDDGWSLIESGLSLETDYYIVVEFTNMAGSGGPYAVWNILVSPTEPTSSYDILTGASSPVTVGIIASGKVYQLHTGGLETYHPFLDSQYGAYESLNYDPTANYLQLHGFDALEDLLSVDLDAAASENIDLVLRVEAASKIIVRYCPITVISDYINNLISEITGGSEYTDPYRLNELETGFWIYDADLETFVRLDDEDGIGFWETGGTRDTCKGASIGNSGGTLAIDLDGAGLYGNWAITDASSKAVLNSQLRKLYDTTAKLAIDFTGRKLYGSDGSLASLDWANRVLKRINGGQTAVDWENGQLNDANNAISVDWVNYGLFLSGAATLKWNLRALYGDWSVGSGGSFNTPTLKVGGTTYAPTTINYKDENDVDQSMTVLAAV